MKRAVGKPFKLILMIPGDLKLCCKDLMIKGKPSQLAFIWHCAAASGFLMSSCRQTGRMEDKLSSDGRDSPPPAA